MGIRQWATFRINVEFDLAFGKDVKAADTTDITVPDALTYHKALISNPHKPETSHCLREAAQ